MSGSGPKKKAQEVHSPEMLILDKILAKPQFYVKIEEIFHETIQYLRFHDEGCLLISIRLYYGQFML